MLIDRQSAGKIKSLAYITGVYLGDGCISRVPKKYSVSFRLNTIDMDFALAVTDALFDLTGRKAYTSTHSVKRSNNLNHALKLGCKDLCNFLESETNKKQKIPDYVKEYDRENMLEFICGLMDSEGYVSLSKRNVNIAEIGFKNTSSWTVDFNGILQSLGFKTKIAICKPYKSHYKPPYRIRINTKSAIENNLYFKIGRKQKKLETLRDYTLGTMKSS